MSINKSPGSLKPIWPPTIPELESEVHLNRQNWRCNMICPSCRNQNEMLFSALSMSFICEEEPCGLELSVDLHTAEVLLQPEVELTLA